ncbi:MAG: cation transporter [Rhodospirillales bacterium]|nr:cation transporter [Rhodospirillales bacterium]
MAGCTHCAGDTGDAAADAGFRRVLWVAFAANAAMFVVEVVAGWIANSVSLEADALDFFGDAASYAITLMVLPLGALARIRAALVKAASMGAFALWIVGDTAHHLIAGLPPEPFVMGPVALAALAANVSVAAMLYRHRNGDSNRESVWLCSRNDAIGNIAVLAAAGGVFATGSPWPDILVAAVIASLNIAAAAKVVRQARGELAALGKPAHAEGDTP